MLGAEPVWMMDQLWTICKPPLTPASWARRLGMRMLVISDCRVKRQDCKYFCAKKLWLCRAVR